MGLFDDFVGGEAPSVPTPAPSQQQRPGQNIFNDFVGGAVVPQPKKIEYNKPFGELKPADPSWTQWLKWKSQDALSAIGMRQDYAQHLGGAAVDIAGITPAGAALSAADLTYDLPRGNYGRAAMDAIGVIPGVTAARRYFQGSPMLRMAETPSSRDVLNAGGAGYRSINNAPVAYHPSAAPDLASGIQLILEHPSSGGLNRFKAPNIHGTLDLWAQRMRERGGSITPADFDALRQQLRGHEGVEGVAGQRAVNVLDRYMYTPPPGMLTRGTQQDLNNIRQTFENARGNWRSGKTAETLENEIDRAGTKSATTYSGRNVDNKTRQQTGALITTDAGEAKWFGATDAERAALEEAIRGDRVTNAARLWSNRLAGGGGWGQTTVGGMGAAAGAGIAKLLGMDPYTVAGAAAAGAMAPTVAGGALRGVANERTVRAVGDVAEQIRRNSPLYAAREAATPAIANPYTQRRDAIASALIGGGRTEAQDWWTGNSVPYENREQPEQPERVTVTPRPGYYEGQ